MDNNMYQVVRTLGFVRGIFFLFLNILSFGIQAQLLEPFHEEEVGGGWSDPVQILFDATGRGYIVERTGLVWILDEGDQKRSEPLIDIREEVVVFGDHGLLSMALHPNFLNNGYFYLLYVVDRHHLMHFGQPTYDPGKTVGEQATIGRITRYTADPATGFTRIIPGSRKILLGDTPENGIPILMPSHGVGSLVFGTDGTLLVSCGDSGSFLSQDIGSAPETSYAQALADGILKPKENIGAFRAQLVDCLNGKILRIDPGTGAGIPGNPFYDASDPHAPRSKVWVLGLRQPYRFILKPGTGSHDPEDANPGVLYIGDVGTGNFEELNIATRGGMNFGWPLFEGFDPKAFFFNAGTTNPDAPNPVSDSNCDHPYFKFDACILQPRSDSAYSFPNPCNPDIEIDPAYTWIHATPIIAWSNEKYNLPTRAVIGTYNDEGRLTPKTLADDGIGIEGENFDGASSITGFFYEDGHFPEQYHGKFFHCDFAGWIRIFEMNDQDSLISVDSFHTATEFIVDMARHPVDGSIYYVQLFHKIFRITYGGNTAPVPVINADKHFGPAPLTVRFDASDSYDAGDDPITYFWEFGDGTTSTQVAPEHTFEGEGNQPKRYDVKLTVTDTAGAARSASMIIATDNTPPVVTIESVRDGDLYSMSGTTYLPLIAHVSDKEHAQGSLSYRWQVFLHHNDHFHPELPDENPQSMAVIAPAGCNGEEYYYRIRLDVTDPAGLSGSEAVYIYPHCGPELLAFTSVNARADQEKVIVEWGVSTPSNVAYFEIERAQNFSPFLPIGTTEGVQFAFIDRAPLQGASAYRIKAVGQDSLYTFSPEVAVDFPAPGPYLLTPNPASDYLMLSMPMTEAQRLDFQLYTPDGKPTFEETILHTVNGSPLETRIDLPHFPDGIYFYRLLDGEKQYFGSILISR